MEWMYKEKVGSRDVEDELEIKEKIEGGRKGI